MNKAPQRRADLHLDVVTIFPDYLRALDLSLIGRATGSGLIDLTVHDLREWTHDRHRTVDDTPLGGGAGMVMKPDVWGRALDEVLDLPARAQDAQAVVKDRSARQVLIVPTPAGQVFTQRTAEDMAGASQIVFACGRYEGIDARVADHYRRCGVEVYELSIGDYVLNGGEVAALVMIEAIVRLRPGVLGNPQSVVEESHSRSGLLEHEVHTRPVSWRETDLALTWPALLSGDHGRIARERRDRAIARTAARRPDLVARLDPDGLDSADRAALARLGWVVPTGAPGPVPVTRRHAEPDDVEALTALARRTFPDACPPWLSAEQIAAHLETSLTPERLWDWVTDPRIIVTLASLDQDVRGQEAVGAGELVGYTAVVLEARDDDGRLPAGLDARPGSMRLPATVPADGPSLAAELSKVYVDARLRGSGLGAALVAAAIEDAAEAGVDLLWLGTNDSNRRAQRAYRGAGFAMAGRRVYEVGGARCRDVVMAVDPRQAPGGAR